MKALKTGAMLATFVTCLAMTAWAGEKPEPGKTARLVAGDYVGGKDLPAGQYVLTRGEDKSGRGIVALSDPADDLQNDYPSKIYESVKPNADRSFFISIDEGGTLRVPFECDLTAVNYMTLGDFDGVAWGEGLYEVGKDVPEGGFVVSDAQEDGRGIIWLSDAEDDLTKDYPSIFYETVKRSQDPSWYLKLKAGRKFYLPMTFSKVEKVDSFDFSGDGALLPAGQYAVGEEVPAGTYELICLQNDTASGIVAVSAPTDRPKEDYPSVLYELTRPKDKDVVYRITVEDGGLITLPFNCVLKNADGGVAFN